MSDVTPLHEPVPPKRPTVWFVHRLIGTGISLAVVIYILATLVHRSGASDRSAQVASQSGASYCTKSGYQIVSHLDNSKTDIYNCEFAAGEKCVVLQNGITSDDTAEVRLLFRNTLGATKPECIA